VFVKVHEDELRRLSKLSARVGVLLAVRLLAYQGVTTKRRTIESLTGVSKRHVNLLLRELERDGFLRRDYCATRTAPWGIFWPREHGRNPSMLLGSVPSKPDVVVGRISSKHTTQVIDPDLIPPSQSEPARARAHASREGGKEVLDQLVILVRELWPNVARSVAAKNVARLRELTDVSDDELASYLRHSAADETLARAKLPLAAACTADRVEPYFARRARARRPEPKPKRRNAGELLSPAESAQLAREAVLMLRRPSR